MTSFMVRHPPFNDLWELLWIFPWIIKGVPNSKKLSLNCNDHSNDNAPGIKRFVKRRLPVLSWPSWAAWAFRSSSAGSRSACDGRRTGCGGRLSSLDSRPGVSKTAQSADSCRRTRPRARKKGWKTFFSSLTVWQNFSLFWSIMLFVENIGNGIIWRLHQKILKFLFYRWEEARTLETSLL